jgi:hypothetical protein
MSEREAVCPECCTPLVVSVEKNKKTGEIQIKFRCEGDYEDKFEFVINTHLKNEDLEMLEKGKAITKEIIIKVVDRVSVPEWQRGDL